MKEKLKLYLNKTQFGTDLLNTTIKYKRKILYFICKLRYKVDKNLILFSSYWGRNYSCNPRGIYEALLENNNYNNYKFVWVFEDKKKFKYIEKNKNTIAVKLYSKKYYKYCSKAKYLITNVSLPEWVTPKRNQVYINTWHGKPMKKIGCNVVDVNQTPKKRKKMVKGFKRSGKRFTYLFSAAPFFTEKMATAYGLNKNSKKVIEVGYPRNDFLFKYKQSDVDRIKKQLGIEPNKKVIFYAPTFRNYKYSKKTKSYVYQNHLNFELLLKNLGKDYVILFKAHNQEENSSNINELHNGVINVNKINDINELYIISDLMISDYSGAIFDYANLKRPMVFYMWDKDVYTNESRGVDFDFNELPGIIVTEEKKLAYAIKKELKEFKYDIKYKKFNKKYNCLDGKDCGKKFIEKYIK